MNWIKEKISAAWAKVLSWCGDSETIVLARAQVLIGIVASAALTVDFGGVLAGTISIKQALFMVAFGVVQEFIRRHRAEDVQ